MITRKSEYRNFNDNLTRKIAEVVVMKLSPSAIVLGGGSFGHFMAHSYGIPGPANEYTRKGASIIHDDMGRLSAMVSEIFQGHGISTFAFSPSELMKNGTTDYSEPLNYAESEIVPLFYGDVYLEGQFFRIYSGDQVMLDLARTGRFSRALFLTDVDGIYDRDPRKFSDARLLKRIEGRIEFSERPGDVTGGMALKHSSMVEMSKHLDQVYLINGNYPGRIATIGTEKFIGTVID
ncbi:MAG: isopentenyl phosphate kinase [Candidatus Thermoplasmatota archaeon]|nr:isopentenyl phosphate kinase [Candidatus Thermoplasmatota archaeon]